jgi:hypothetical protein
MSATDRQNRLLVAEDWKRVYQSFRFADFKSYDFDNLRRTMIDYIRENYPEDFNDYIESSEYLALIDMIAMLGQNIAFRIDLNARENFLELAERRESILRLARLLSYNAKRNIAASGLLKIESIQTTEGIVDSNNFDISSQNVVWNDFTNSNWYEQFIKILNAALPASNTYGRPVKKDNIDGIPTDQYRIQGASTELAKFSFNKTIDGRSLPFEIVSSDIDDGIINEESPLPGNNLALLYRDDGQGPSSTNSGFFLLFKQGITDEGTFTITSPTVNQVVSIDAIDVNNTDVWLYKLDSAGNESELWTQVESTKGNNAIYNSLSKNIRTFYSVLTRVEDRISLAFSDGIFGDLPKGTFKVYYRSSANKSFSLTPTAFGSTSISVPYTSKAGRQEVLTINLALQYTVDNASTSESNDSIKVNAPATYYTQNRMVTAEDYNIVPLTTSQEIIKAKSVNRTASGISRYFDLIDATGKYSQTNLYGTDGVLYKETVHNKSNFSFTTRADVEGVIYTQLEPILSNVNLKNYYYDSYTRLNYEALNYVWVNDETTSATNITTGYFQTGNDRLKVSTYTSGDLKLIKPGSLVKFIAPTGFHFMADGTMMQGEPNHRGAVTSKWAKIVSIVGDGTGNNGITLNDIIPDDAIISEIIPSFSIQFTDDTRALLINQIFAYKKFGLRYDINDQTWKVITALNLNTLSGFSLGNAGNTSNQNLDASWLLLFETDGNNYYVTYRSLRYIFESNTEIRFFFDSSDKIYNNKTGKTVKDKISILNINNDLNADLPTVPFTKDFDWEITENYRDSEGYVSSKKVEVGFFDYDDDGVVDDPSIFETVVPPDNYIFLKKYSPSNDVEDFKYLDNSTNEVIPVAGTQQVGTTIGQVYYIKNIDTFKVYTATGLETVSDYKAFLGRNDLKFHYIHNADQNNRIDPSSTNIIDTYMLTQEYDIKFRQYLSGELTSRPLPLSSDSLYLKFGKEINKVKSVSDEVIYHPVKYKILFGPQAATEMQATFKVVKNPDIVLNDNDIKTRVVEAINEFFALENWEFGDTFYFSELSAYIINKMSPDLVTIVIVPNSDTQGFGSLYEIKSEDDEIFISGATVNDVELITGITASRLKASGNIVTGSSSSNIGITSTSLNTTSSNTGGYSY